MEENKVISDDFEWEKQCHEPGCGKPLPRGKSLMAWYCQTIGLCRYCYGHKYHGRGRPAPKPTTPGGERFLSWSERRWLIEHQFDGAEELIWSAEFLAEWRDYIDALWRGEVNI